MSEHAVRLVLPLPIAVNRWPKHPLQEHRMKNEYRKAAWVAAIQQAKPVRDPPEKVRVEARFYLRNRRDEDKLKGSLAWVLDALKREQTGSLRWRQNAYDLCGYFLDDDPRHCAVAEPEQVIDRKAPRVEVIVRAVA